MKKMTGENIAVVRKGIGAIATAIRELSMKRKRSSKLAENPQEVIGVTTEVTSEVVPGVVN